MKSKLFLSGVFLLLLCLSGECNDLSKSKIHHILVDGKNREYLLHIPKNLPENAALVFVLHGYTDHAQNMMNTTEMNKIADKNGFAVCYPQGLTDERGNTFWEVGYTFTQSKKVDDVNFLSELAVHLQNEFKLSSQNTFATGMSNGGDMSIMLACEAPEVFKAVAPVCGCMMKCNFEACNSTKPIPVFLINSTADSTTYWNGDMLDKQGWGAYLPVKENLDFWIKKNLCTSIVTDTVPDIDKNDRSYVITEKYSSTKNGNQVWFYKVVNGGHDWPGYSGNKDINASQEVWNFFSLFIKP